MATFSTVIYFFLYLDEEILKYTSKSNTYVVLVTVFKFILQQNA